MSAVLLGQNREYFEIFYQLQFILMHRIVYVLRPIVKAITVRMAGKVVRINMFDFDKKNVCEM